LDPETRAAKAGLEMDKDSNTYHTTIKSTPAVVWASDHIGHARKNIKAVAGRWPYDCPQHPGPDSVL